MILAPVGDSGKFAGTPEASFMFQSYQQCGLLLFCVATNIPAKFW